MILGLPFSNQLFPNLMGALGATTFSYHPFIPVPDRGSSNPIARNFIKFANASIGYILGMTIGELTLKLFRTFTPLTFQSSLSQGLLFLATLSALYLFETLVDRISELFSGNSGSHSVPASPFKRSN